jgi:hypothetical protein
LFKSNATAMTTNSAMGIAMSSEGIVSRIIKDAFISLVKNKRNTPRYFHEGG